MALVTTTWHLDGYDDPPDQSAIGTPPRRPSSIRRTSSLEATWPGGRGTPMSLTGRARDLLTRDDGSPEVREVVDAHLVIGPDHAVAAISTDPPAPSLDTLVGHSAMSGFRRALREALPAEGDLTYALLDDVAIISRIGGVAWSHLQATLEQPIKAPATPSQYIPQTRDGHAVCSGLRPDGYQERSWARDIMFPHYLRLAGDLEAGGDPWAWHELDDAPMTRMRRRRRIDAWLHKSDIEVDMHFRDSSWEPEGAEVAIHEYEVRVTVDATSNVVHSIRATGLVLPFPECPFAANQVEALVGMTLTDFRSTVPRTLTGIRCCTHLNDTLRGLADVPTMNAVLRDPRVTSAIP